MEALALSWCLISSSVEALPEPAPKNAPTMVDIMPPPTPLEEEEVSPLLSCRSPVALFAWELEIFKFGKF